MEEGEAGESEGGVTMEEGLEMQHSRFEDGERRS